MTRFKKFHKTMIIVILIAGSLVLSSCGGTDRSADPADWGYDRTVTYDALGGVVNNHGVRETYYMENSYLFRPSGSTNMLIEPVKDGYILAGWYTAKEDIKDADGNITGYSFKPEDRWDFDLDRVQEDMTLYARWIPQARVEYVDGSTGEVMFSKNITEDSPVQPLSSAAEGLISKPGFTFDGYYADKECTINYDFNEYEHGDLNLSNEGIYAKLFEEFPSYIEKAEYVEPEEVEEDSDEESPETTKSNPDLFINKLGYRINTEDENARAEIRKAKDRIYDEAISRYIDATADKVVYLKYSEGSYIHVNKVDDLKSGGKTWFSGVNKLGDPVDGYIFMADIDFKGAALTTAEGFSGKIMGNGHSLKNISINISSKKIDKDTKKEVGMFTELDGAYIENLTIEDMNIKLKVNPGITVTAGALAAKAKNTELKNVKIEGLTIDTGKGDDGSAAYKIGDIFGTDSNTKLDNVTGKNIDINASESAQVNRLLTE